MPPRPVAVRPPTPRLRRAAPLPLVIAPRAVDGIRPMDRPSRAMTRDDPAKVVRREPGAWIHRMERSRADPAGRRSSGPGGTRLRSRHGGHRGAAGRRRADRGAVDRRPAGDQRARVVQRRVDHLPASHLGPPKGDVAGSDAPATDDPAPPGVPRAARRKVEARYLHALPTPAHVVPPQVSRNRATVPRVAAPRRADHADRPVAGVPRRGVRAA